jgi:cysteine-rich repeat protein
MHRVFVVFGLATGVLACDALVSNEYSVSDDVCFADTDCAGGSVCDADAHVCVECMRDADCRSGDRCDLGNRECVDCVEHSDCAPGLVCTDQVCSPSCADGSKNGRETGTDCGGPDCGSCPPGETCLENGDCTSAFCEGGVCDAVVCGNGVRQDDELCDDGNVDGGDGCGADCHPESCGDGHLSEAVEECDDGDITDGDGCDSNCTFSGCGNGVRAGAEGCDDGNMANGDGCDANCSVTGCGNGIVTAGEACDDGNAVESDGCDSECNPSGCGNGLINVGEGCDDNNTSNGDGCSACKVDAGWTCGGAPSLCELLGSCSNPIEVTQSGYVFQTSDFAMFGNDLNNCLQSGYAGAADVVFKVDLQANQTLRVTEESSSAVLFNLMGSVCSSAQACLATYGGSLLSWKETIPGLVFKAPTSGSYHVVVESNMQSSAGKPLQVKFEIGTCGDGVRSLGEECDDGNLTNGDGCSPACVAEKDFWCSGSPSVCAKPPIEVGANDTKSAADSNVIQLTASGGLVVGSIATMSDVDVYRVTLATPQVMRFETFSRAGDCVASNPQYPFATRLRVFNSLFVQMYEDTNSGIEECSAVVASLAAGTYYVSVEQAGFGAIPSYFLEVKPQAAAGQESEPNDTQPTADSNLGTGNNVFVLGGHLANGDTDYYAISVGQGASIRAEIIEGDMLETCESGGIDSELTVYDSLAQLFEGDFSNSGRGGCSMVDGTGSNARDPGLSMLPMGTYYVAVRADAIVQQGTNPAGQFNYRLQVTVRGN